VIAKLLVANRGEIAARVLRTARAMGIATVAVFSDPDRDAPFVAQADEAVPLGGATPAEAVRRAPAPSRRASALAESYLRVDAILDAAERTGADAVHPGYGFLAESPELAAGCRKRGLAFVGPPSEVLAALGDKLEAKRVATAAGVPVLPGVAVGGQGAGDLAAAAGRVGFPLVVKATHGGGGIGMAVARDPGDLAAAVDAARRQAGSAFGDDAVFLERWLEAPRHVEVQLLADAGGRMVQLFERECSIQRRHQKLIEESPSPAVGPDLRRRLGEAALAVARAVGYVGAGTVEFLLEGPGDGPSSSDGAAVDPDGGRFWFLEVNPRIQVEHPVTEAVTGLDLVRLQLLAAAGEPLPPEATRAELHGHAVEARLYAEDPSAGFLPRTGTVHRFEIAGGGPGAGGDPAVLGPGGWGVRVDAGVAEGSVVGVHYDPLLAKVVAHAPTRPEAARMLASALSTARLHGVVTNRDLLVGVLRSAPFLSGETDTAFLDRHPPAELTAAGGSAGQPGEPSAVRLHAAVAALAAQAERRATATVYPAVPSGWRNNPSQLQRTDLELGRPPGPGGVGGPVGISVAYRFDRTGTLEALEVDGDPLPGFRLWHCSPDPAHPPGRGGGQATRTWLVDLEADGVRRRFQVHRVGDTAYVDSPLGHTELRERPQDPELPGAEGRPAAGTPPGGRPAAGASPEGLWTTGPAPSGGRLRSPTGGLDAAGSRGSVGAHGSRGGAGAVGSPGGAGADSEQGVLPAGADGAAVAPLPGIVRQVAVRVGDRVDAGAVLVVVEAMKTEHRIAAGRAGRVRRVLVAEGQEVAAGATVVELEEAPDG
jgi:propionyl-CoA carboxylase alpha chain